VTATGSRRDSYDVVVVGGGHNGLVSSFYLARAGLSVGVLEARDRVGGACKTEEIIPGFRFSTCANWIGWWRAKIIEEMDLLGRGLEVGGADLWSRVLPDGSGFTWWNQEDELKAEIGRFSHQDAARWSEWRSFWTAVSSALGPWLLSYPPSWEQLTDGSSAAAGSLRYLRDHSVAEAIDHYFETEVMRSGIVAPHDVGSMYEPGSGILLGLSEAMRNFSETGRPAPHGYVKGGMGAISDAMAEAAKEAGAEIFTRAAVERVVVSDGRVVGVALADGETIEAKAIVLGCDPATSIRLLDDSLDPALARRLSLLKAQVAPLKLHCAMSGLPEWAAFPGSDLPYQGPLALFRTRDQSEEVWAAAVAGELPKDPLMAVMVPSTWDRSLAPPGKHTLSVWTLYAPVTPRQGSWSTRREEMLELMLTALEKDAPGFREHLIDAVLLTPEDLEVRVGLTHGNIHHIDMSPDQIFSQRPLPELATYRYPIDGLYSCGSSQHPSGEVSGAPGHNAAHAVLEDRGIIDARWQQCDTTSI
jgi:phytoene dehydrogenase-like protein